MHWAADGSRSKELVVNHLECNGEITKKTNLVRNLKTFYKSNVQYVEQNYQVFETSPLSYVVTSKLDTYEFK